MTCILILEDNQDMLTMLSQVLDWGGYEVIAGHNGLEGIKILEGLDMLPHLIISDLSMPDMDGFETLQHVRDTPEWADLPFVIMSAHSSPDDRRNALNYGADDFLVKPFNLEDFQRVLQRWEITG